MCSVIGIGNSEFRFFKCFMFNFFFFYGIGEVKIEVGFSLLLDFDSNRFRGLEGYGRVFGDYM